MDTEKQVAALIQKAYDRLKAFGASDGGGRDSFGADDPVVRGVEALEESKAFLEEAIVADDDAEAKHALKSVNWWLVNLTRAEGIANSYERGEFILARLRQYYTFLDTLPEDYDLCQDAIRRFVFSGALRCFRDLLGDGVNMHDPGLLLLVGRCYKGVGIYDEAFRYIEQAARFRRDDGETLAELADVNALLGETENAKALFREAFFVGPDRIELRMMESELILRLRDKLVREKGFREPELREWIPVYGKLWGVFSVIRDLKGIEFGRLRQSITAIETECRGNPSLAAVRKPRLINRYFWLIDYYDIRKEDPILREDVLMKIKLADSEIYDRYTQ